eukprot:CAMPEP_0181533238 /NCGR_PEP_ID=MMETSP1110-20121109/73047_1 /TAXON_ID=174948 /ORGANISM="Symbiodinium sp., Strain CCMP421" /LENGTH=93 /DNA_ID=CAMNT_0023664401 /DNA_START=67 /DNA_END=348 /DNA_ORIENTATION=+
MSTSTRFGIGSRFSIIGKADIISTSTVCFRIQSLVDRQPLVSPMASSSVSLSSSSPIWSQPTHLAYSCSFLAMMTASRVCCFFLSFVSPVLVR